MKKKTRQGFTMVELSLAMIFIGILSLALAFIVTSTLASYRRGLTLNQVNEIGQAIVDDVRAAVQNSSGKSVMALCSTYYYKGGTDHTQENNCLQDGARSFIHLEKKADVKLKNGTILADLPVYGAFCAGTYTYLWASGYYYMDGVTIDGSQAKYIRPEFDGRKFRLIKISDPNRVICKKSAGLVTTMTLGGYSYGNYSSSTSIDLSRNFVSDPGLGVTDDGVELLNTKDGVADLALYTFDINNPAESETEGNAFYSGSFILGTVDGGMNIKESGRTCEPPSNYSGNFDYCAINKFSFAAQTNGAKF